MEARQKELAEFKSYIEGIDKEVTMILQSLQWDRRQLLEGSSKVSCSYDAGHRVPPDRKEEHEKECCLRSQGYSEEDKLLPQPLDPNADTVVKFCEEDIRKIIENASKNDPMFKKGCPGPQPLTLERLQATYTADERRAIHDAAVSAAPACHDLADLALISSTGDNTTSQPKSRLEVLAELRDMRRRRTKYRVSGANTNNYSHVLRDVIRTQMELYSVTHATNTNEKTMVETQKDLNKGLSHVEVPTQNKYDENKDRSKEKERYTDTGDSNRIHRKRYDEYTDTYQSSDHNNSKDSHKTIYDTQSDRHEKHYSKVEKYYDHHDDRNKIQFRKDYDDHDRHSKKDKQSRSLYKERNRRDDKYETKTVIKEKFDTRDRYSDYSESKRDKYSRKHKGDYYEEGSSSSSSKSKRRHTHDDNGSDRHRDGRDKPKLKDDKKRRGKESSEKYSEARYKRYYDTVDVKKEMDSS